MLQWQQERFACFKYIRNRSTWIRSLKILHRWVLSEEAIQVTPDSIRITRWERRGISTIHHVYLSKHDVSISTCMVLKYHKTGSTLWLKASNVLLHILTCLIFLAFLLCHIRSTCILLNENNNTWLTYIIICYIWGPFWTMAHTELKVHMY